MCLIEELVVRIYARFFSISFKYNLSICRINSHDAATYEVFLSESVLQISFSIIKIPSAFAASVCALLSSKEACFSAISTCRAFS